MEETIEPQTENKSKINPFLIVGGLMFLGIIIVVPVILSSKKPASKVEAAQYVPVKEFTVNGSNFAFNPKIITVNKGDTIKINFKDDEGSHNLVIKGYNVLTNVVGEGGTDSATFVADKSGSFEYYCSVDSHRDLGMTGTLVVR